MSLSRLADLDSRNYRHGVLSCGVVLADMIFPLLSMKDLVGLGRVNRFLRVACRGAAAARFKRYIVELQRAKWVVFACIHPNHLPVVHHDHPRELDALFIGCPFLNPTFRRQSTALNKVLDRLAAFDLDWTIGMDGVARWRQYPDWADPRTHLRPDNVVVLLRRPYHGQSIVPMASFPDTAAAGRVWGAGVLAHEYMFSQRRLVNTLVTAGDISIMEMPSHYEQWYTGLPYVSLRLDAVSAEQLYSCFTCIIDDLFAESRFLAGQDAEALNDLYSIFVPKTVLPAADEDYKLALAFCEVVLAS